MWERRIVTYIKWNSWGLYRT